MTVSETTVTIDAQSFAVSKYCFCEELSHGLETEQGTADISVFESSTDYN